MSHYVIFTYLCILVSSTYYAVCVFFFFPSSYVPYVASFSVHFSLPLRFYLPFIDCDKHILPL